MWSRTTSALGRLSIDVKGRCAQVEGVTLPLTRLELCILEVLAARTGRVVSKDALMASVCQWDEHLTPNAVEIHIHRIRKKIHSADVRIRTIRGLGYLMEASDDTTTVA